MSTPPPHKEDRVRCTSCGKRFVGEAARQRFRDWPRRCKDQRSCSLTLTYASGDGQLRQKL